ncbi:cytochrome P450 [Nocardia aobensis]|uniref:Cytochrome P450 n=1 Tax=Nocardia aobensis TaxID=257277 RepID=A0ABW6PDP4_9NOCA
MTVIRFPSGDARSLKVDRNFLELLGGERIGRGQFPFGSECWLVADHAAIRRIYTDPAFARHASEMANSPRVMSSALLQPGAIAGLAADQHARIRRVIRSMLSKTYVAQTTPVIREICATAVARLLALPSDEVDLVETYTEQVPMLTLCHILGLPAADTEFLRRHVSKSFDNSSDADPSASRDSLIELVKYLAEAVEQRRVSDENDLLSELARRNRYGELPDFEIAIIGMALLFAGYETTAILLSKFVYYLLGRPGGLEATRTWPERYVDELLRLIPLAGGEMLPWVATEDVELCGHVIEAGEFVMPLSGAANFDPEIFDRPTDFEPARDRCPHLSFGYGEYYCLGADLARVEIHAAIAALREAFPAMRLTDGIASARWRTGHALWALESLTVSKS